MIAERRRKRSNYAGLSLNYLLSNLARRQGLPAIVLADSAGLLIASSLSGPEADEIAAMAPLISDPQNRAGDMDVDNSDVPLTVCGVKVNNTKLYLCAVGEKNKGLETLRVAASGVKRILSVH